MTQSQLVACDIPPIPSQYSQSVGKAQYKWAAARWSPGRRKQVCQRCFGFGTSLLDVACSALARLAARFCLSVVLDFLLIDCRGDLSDISDPFVWGPVGPSSPYRTPRRCRRAGRTLPASPPVTTTSLNGCYSHRLRTLVSLADVELNPLVLFKRSKTASSDFAVVNEHIFCAAVRSDKTEALVAVKPFHSSLCHTLQLLSFRTHVRKTS